MKPPIKNIAEINYAPEFDCINSEALDYCIENGATKLKGVISQDTLKKLGNGVPLHLELLTLLAPEINEFLNLFDIEQTDTRINVQNQGAWTEPGYVLSHVDAEFAPVGISLLLPFSGEPAFFGADDERFGLLTDGFPSFMAVYGLGDAIMLRQQVKDIYSGIDYPQVHHVGVGSTERRLITLDVLQEEVSGVRI